MADGYIIAGDGTVANKNVTAAQPLDWPPAPLGYNDNSYVADYKIESGVLYLSVFKKILPIPGSPPYFTELDSANRPNVTGGAASAFYPDSGGNAIYFAYTTGDAAPIIIRTFNLDTETWGAIISSAGPTPSQRAQFRFVHRANGDWVVFFDSTTGPETLDTWWSKYNGSWSAAVRVSTVSSGGSDAARVADICLNEGTGDVALFWFQTLFSEGYTPSHLYVTVLSSADALGAAFNWLNTATATPFWETYGRPVYNSEQDQWEYPGLFKNLTNNFFNTHAVMSISPAAAPAVVTQTNIIAADGGTFNVAFPRLAVDVTALTLNFLWANNYDGTTGNPQLLIVSRPLDNSSPFPVTRSLDIYGADVWTPDGMIYDPDLQTFQIDTTLDGVVLFDDGPDALHPEPEIDGGTPFMDLTMFSVQDGTYRAANNPLCAYQYYFELAADTDLALTCPLPATGTVGAFFTATLTASGGVPPYTYSIVSGSLPPGVTLNATTGVISGTPLTTGSFPVTYRVTDSLAATATTGAPCPLVISNPEEGSCVQFELRRVTASLKPAVRLPVRGRA